MELSLFDLHCDTAYEAHRKQQSLRSNTLAVSFDGASRYRRYVQVMAIWTDHALSDGDGWNAYRSILKHLRSDPSLSEGVARLCCSIGEIDSDRIRLLLAVEDARILQNQIARVDELFSDGVRILTPLWSGESCIGGSHDTSVGLTAFGKAALEKASRFGILLDVSHASERSFEEILEISAQNSRPALATHSNAYALTPVSRNLKDWQIDRLIQHNGLIGINLHVPFLTRKNGTATVTDVLAHIEYFLERGAMHHLALGGDLDGSTPPCELDSVSKLYHLADAMQKANYSDELIHAIFFDNAHRFATTYIL